MTNVIEFKRSAVLSKIFSACLCVLCGSAVKYGAKALTAESQRTQRYAEFKVTHYQFKTNLDLLPKVGYLSGCLNLLVSLFFSRLQV